MWIIALILQDTELNGFVPCLSGLEEEDNLLPRLQEAQQFLAILDRDDYFNCTSCAPPVHKRTSRILHSKRTAWILEENLLPRLQEVQKFVAILESQCYNPHLHTQAC